MKLYATLAGLAPVAGLLVSAGCASQAPYVNQHWSNRSMGPSLSRAFLSYDAESDGLYRDFAWQKKRSINLTFSRHLFNYNPENPFQSETSDFYNPRPNHSLVPRTAEYIHLEGLVMGGILYASGGLFIPLPLDSIIGTFEDGGTEEFVDGVGEFVRPVGVVTASFMHDGLGLQETRGDAWRHQDD